MYILKIVIFICLLLVTPFLSREEGLYFLLEHFIPKKFNISLDILPGLFYVYQMSIRFIVIIVGWFTLRHYIAQDIKCPVKINRILKVSFIFICVSFVVGYLTEVIYSVVGSDHLEKLVYQSTPVFEYNDSIVWPSVIKTFLMICVLAPIIEEMTYRAILLKGLTYKLPFFISSILSSLTFASVHEEFFFPFVLGIMLSYIYKNMGLIYSICVHAIYNIFHLTYLVVFFLQNDFYYYPASSSTYMPSWDTIGATLILTLFISYKYYNYWKERGYEKLDH
ncbi:hypothetical protein V12B01_02575 [Vibrio splendidus 12B01]|nr:hypothetical protein V12B01_02575 [Vibrio splendidus 12B01]PMJ63170.1 hypothetical protein BCU18_20150 [Vibrio lentus]